MKDFGSGGKAGLRWTTYRRRLRRPFATAHGEITEREGAIVCLEDGEGRRTFGELAPWPEWGSETLAAAIGWLTTSDTEWAAADSVWNVALERTCLLAADSAKTLPAASFALACAAMSAAEEGNAWDGLDGWRWPTAFLLPTGREALEAGSAAYDSGHTVCKMKAGLQAAPEEWAVWEGLIRRWPGMRWRIDANGGWDGRVAQWWFERLADRPCVQFVEQPLAPGREEETLRLIERYGVPVALDESWPLVRENRQFLETWPGWVSVKPSLCGLPTVLLEQLKPLGNRVVFSTAMETGIGLRGWLRRVAVPWARQRSWDLQADQSDWPALGLGGGWWENDGWGPDRFAPFLDPAQPPWEGDGEIWERIWREC